jgi:hypothetical protein
MTPAATGSCSATASSPRLPLGAFLEAGPFDIDDGGRIVGFYF